ncbi:hypothetical protein BV898_19134 [Hypsibius exemplaris]|uniref:ATP-dependent DNA helicase n=1 Tax=Hypsibius exemplaris TaxID=2072580 RepID=A0A9X6NK78_HYPEX|nr:hypothetical protein BV898_19134 [Hypsibius exemplaris]
MRLRNLTDADMQMLQHASSPREKLIELDMNAGSGVFPFRKEKNAYNVDVLGRLHLSHYRAVDREANGDVVTSALSSKYFALMEKRGRIPAACLSVRVGTKLMLLRNLPNGQANFGWVNGAMCIVEELTDDCIIVYMQSHPKRRLPFKRLQHDLPSNRGPKSQRWQFPFDLAYGCTVHKAQGQSLTPCVYDADRQAFSGGGYTACSRATGLQQLYFLSLGKKEQYFLLPQLKQLLEWMDFYDISRGWDEKRRRAALPFIPYPKPGLKNIGLQIARPTKNAGTASFIVPPEINPEDEEDFVDEFNPELLILEPCSVAEDGGLLAVLAAIHLLPLPSSTDARSSVITNAEYMSTVSEVLRGCADVLDTIRVKVQESAAYFNIITQKQQIDRAALKGMVLWMQKCHLPLTTLGDGHCLFRALSWTLFGHQDGHLRLRLLSISVISEHHAYFFTYRRLLSMKENFSLPEMIHHTSNSSPTFDNGWGNAYNIKSIAIAAQRKIFVYGPVNREDPRFHDELNLFQTLARAAHESECPHKAFYPAEEYQTSGRRSLCIMLLGERQFAHYVGILPRHRSLRESPEFAVARRYDISVGSTLDWGYVSSDDDDKGLPRTSQKRTISHLFTLVRDPPNRITTLKQTPVQMSGGRKRSLSPTEAFPNPKKQYALLSPVKGAKG